MVTRAALSASIVLALAACEPEPEPAVQYESAEDQLIAEYGGEVDPGTVSRVLEISQELVLKHRAAGVDAMTSALKDDLGRRGLDAKVLDGIQDFTLGEPLPGVGDYWESTSGGVSSKTQAIGADNDNAQYWECPPMQMTGNGMSCAEMVDAVVVKVRNDVPAEAIQAEARQQIDDDPLLGLQPEEFKEYATAYLVSLMLAVRTFGADVAAIQGEYAMRDAAVCDQTLVDGPEIARMRGIEESVEILRTVIGRGNLTLAPQGGECLKIGQSGAQTEQRIKRVVDEFVAENPLCPDLSSGNPLLQQAEKLRREGIERGITAHTTTIWVGTIRRGIRTTGTEYTVAVVDGCQPKDQARYTTSPLVIDLAGDGLELSTDRVTFDLRATGQRQRVTWPAQSEGLLAIDLDGDGRVTNGRELFGDRSLCGADRCADGAAALAAYDHPARGGNGDGRVDARDAVFSRLRVWVDRDHDGRSAADELADLAAHGIRGFSLAPRYFDERVPAGRISLSLDVDTAAGSRVAYDVWFENLASAGFPIPLD